MRFFESSALLQPSGMTHLQLRLGTVSALMMGLLSRHRWSQQLCCCVTSSSYRATHLCVNHSLLSPGQTMLWCVWLQGSPVARCSSCNALCAAC